MFEVMVLASNIRKNRMRCGLTQGELAEQLMVSSQAVSKWEKGISTPDLSNLCMLSSVLMVSTDELLKNEDMRKYGKVMIGIDGGGTKTEFVLFSEYGFIIKRIVLENSNPNACGIENTCRVLEKGINAFLSISPDVRGIYVGIAGYNSGKNSENINAFLKQKYASIKIKCNSDILNVISSVTEQEKCTAIISGTGSVVYAKNRDKIYRTGGWGYLLDQAGSGYDIGREALCAVLAEDDGIGMATLLKRLLEDKLGRSVWDSIDLIYKKGNHYIASFAPLVFEAYDQGDQIAEKIIMRTVDRLSFLVNRSIDIYHSGKTVVLGGSILKEDSVVVRKLREKNEGLNFIVLKTPQIYGACVQCCKLCGIKEDNFKENFMSDYEMFVEETNYAEN